MLMKLTPYVSLFALSLCVDHTLHPAGIKYVKEEEKIHRKRAV